MAAAEEEERKDVSGPKPSLPSNYVTLAQLQDRWLKEQARKKQKEEENERLQRERQQLELEQLQREKAELDRKNLQEYDVVKYRDQNEVAVRRRNDSRHQNRHHHQAEESRIESAVADDVEKIRDESKFKWNKKKRRKPRVDGLGTGGTHQVEPEEGKVEKVEVNVNEGTSKINGGTIEVERDQAIVEKVKVKEGTLKFNGKYRGDHRKNRLVWEEKTSSAPLPLHQMVEGLSVNGGKEEGSNVRIKKGSRWLELREPRDDGGKKGNVSSQEGSNGHNKNMVLRQRREDGGKEGNVSSQEGSNGHNRNMVLRERRDDGEKEGNVSSLEGSNDHNRYRKGSEWLELRGRRDDGGKERNVSSRYGSNGHHRRGSKWFKSRERRDDNFVWVKKGEVTDAAALVNAVQHSGTIMMDGKE